MPSVENQSIESPHQYPNNFDSTYTVSKPGASRIRVHFSKFITLPGDTLEYERYFEYLSDKKIKLSGDYSSGFWTHWIEGDSFSFDFKTDKSKRAYGFKIDRIEYYN